MVKLLLIEDEIFLQEEIITWLTLEGFEVLSAADGLTGIELAQTTIPDLILCDIMLPHADGLEILQTLRQNSATATIPFIFTTAKADKSEIRQGMDLGADDYLTKPFSHKELLAAIQTRLNKHRMAQLHQVTAVMRQVIHSSDQKAQRLAENLYQHLRQDLVNLQTLLGLAERLPSHNLPNLIEDGQKMLTQLLGQIERTALELYPPVVEHLGLLPTLLWQTEEWSKKTGLTIHFQHHGLQQTFSTPLKVVVYQILEEALSNIHRHAQTEAVFITLWADKQGLRGEISDHGVGFALEGLFSQTPKLGLIMMMERAYSLQGELTFYSEPQQGTQIHFQLPLKAVIPLMPTPAQPVTVTASVAPVYSVLLADDNPLIRRGLASLLNAETDFHLNAEIASGEQLLDSLNQHQPQLLILDLSLPHLDVINTLPKCLAISPQTQIVVLSPHSEYVYAWEALQQGARGCILKKNAVTELIPALRQVQQGQAYLSPDLRQQPAEGYWLKRRTEVQDVFFTLTEREREIFDLILQDHSNQTIAERLVLSIRTVETHRANLMRKLGLRNKSDLLRYAIKRGLIAS